MTAQETATTAVDPTYQQRSVTRFLELAGAHPETSEMVQMIPLMMGQIGSSFGVDQEQRGAIDAGEMFTTFEVLAELWYRATNDELRDQ